MIRSNHDQSAQQDWNLALEGLWRKLLTLDSKYVLYLEPEQKALPFSGSRLHLQVLGEGAGEGPVSPASESGNEV